MACQGWVTTWQMVTVDRNVTIRPQGDLYHDVTTALAKCIRDET